MKHEIVEAKIWTDDSSRKPIICLRCGLIGTLYEDKNPNLAPMIMGLPIECSDTVKRELKR